MFMDSPGPASGPHLAVTRRIRLLWYDGPVQDVQIYNNVFFIGKDLDIPVFLFTDWDGWSQGIQVANNIFYAEGKARYASGMKKNPDGTYQDTMGFGRSRNNLFDHNLYFGNHANPPRSASDIAGDPQLINPGTGTNGFASLEGYRIRPGSPCRGAAKLIAANGGRDFFGTEVPVNSPPSIGACER
jgi:hypothetical protein